MLPIKFITQKEVEILKLKSIAENVNILYLYKEYYILRILSYFNQIWLNECLVLKWWTSLSLFHWSWRYSEDIDCDLSKRENAFHTVKVKLKSLNKHRNKEWFWFIFDEITDSKAKWSFRFTYLDNRNWFETVTFDFRFVDIVDSYNKPLIRTSLLLDLPSFSFPCHLDKNILCSKLMAVGWREKWRDLYDLNYLIKSWYKLNLDFFEILFTTQTKGSQEKNIFYPVKSIEEVKIQLLDRINSLYNNSTELLQDINDFLPRSYKILDFNEFFLELHDQVTDQLSEFDDFSWLDDFSFESSINFENILREEDSPKRIKIIDFLKKWSSREEVTQIKSLKNWDKLQIVKNYNSTYIIIDWNTGKIKKGFKTKKELIDFLYQFYDLYIKE